MASIKPYQSSPFWAKFTISTQFHNLGQALVSLAKCKLSFILKSPLQSAGAVFNHICRHLVLSQNECFSFLLLDKIMLRQCPFPLPRQMEGPMGGRGDAGVSFAAVNTNIIAHFSYKYHCTQLLSQIFSFHMNIIVFKHLHPKSPLKIYGILAKFSQILKIWLKFHMSQFTC